MRTVNEPIASTMRQAAGVGHPEEMRARVRLRVGKRASLQMTARTTPAGLITAGIMVSGILLAVATLVWSIRRPRA